MKIVKSTITKINVIFFLAFVLFAGMFTAISFPSSSFIISTEVLAQKAEESQDNNEEMCISYNKSKNINSNTCKYADFADVIPIKINMLTHL